MFSRHSFTTLLLAVALSSGAGVFLGSHSPARGDEKKLTNADYARDAVDHLRKAHEDVDHLVNAAADRKEKGYPDAQEAKKAIDRADKALGRYLDAAAK